jgi:hypothetical protein
MRQLQGQVWAVRLPGRVVPETALDEMRPDRVQRQPERQIDVVPELGAVVEPGGVEVGDGADDGREEPPVGPRPARDVRLSLPLSVLLGENPANRRCRVGLQCVEGRPQLADLGRTEPLGEPGRLVETG